MGTAKRERQKANRALKRIEEEQEVKKAAIKRTTLKWGAAIVAGLAAVLLIAWVGGAFDGDDDEAGSITDLTTETVPSDSETLGSAPLTSDTPATEPEVAGSTPAAGGECPPADGSAEQVREFSAAQPMCIDAANTYTAEIVTSEGTLTAELFADQAPQTVNNFVTLARYHYFDGISCHRIIPGFMAQCGDPTGTGSGGPGYTFPDELPTGEDAYKTGVLAMANAGPNTNGSQFFIMLADYPLPPNYSVFGQVTEGLDDTIPALDAAGNPDPSSNGVPPAVPVTLESVTITEG